MENSKTKRTTTRTTSSKAAKKTTTTTATTEENTVEEDTKKQYKVKKDLDPNMYVTVRNGFNGTLVYKSKKTGERFVWDEFGDEQEIELIELKSAKNSYKTFFINNWFLFDDPEVIEWLGLTSYYKHALNFEDFDKLFSKSPEEIEETISHLSDGQKKSVAFRAKQLIANSEIDSLKVINVLEKSLDIELIEH